MQTLQVVCGEQNGPTAGTNFYQSDVLINSIVHFIIVDNIPENDLGVNPDFGFETKSGKIKRGNNIWVLGNKMIVVYSKCNC